MKKTAAYQTIYQELVQKILAGQWSRLTDGGAELLRKFE